MSMESWAEREVEIACKVENPDRKEGEFDYGCACYESALKAYKSLMEDGHSGMSIQFTKDILVKLIEGKPLTPIKDVDEEWNLVYECDGKETFQCKRMYSLFKYVDPDGTVTYSDNDRVVCVDIDNGDNCYNFGLVRNIINELYPITMPYYPTKPIKVNVEDFLFDEKNGDFDTVGIHNAILPSGEIEKIHKFYKESEDGFVEITYSEYLSRKKTALEKSTDEKGE